MDATTDQEGALDQVAVGSDHGNANPGLNGMGPSHLESNGCFERLAGVKATATYLRERLAYVERLQVPDIDGIRHAG